ncbi:diguanylate cyclase [Thaumasiovibrio sp. DFM-14]|uniref:GGDEF domain-containing protein n=1 Tax=Thaumasiovibrio sp. DFM-14 TaxID=3384792 RepID=UPI0039A22794
MTNNNYADQLSHMREQLETAQAEYRESTLAAVRDIGLMKRTLIHICTALIGDSHELDELLHDVCPLLENKNTLISQLVPKLALLERLCQSQSAKKVDHFKRLNQQIEQSSNVINRTRELPAQFQRDIANQLHRTASTGHHDTLTRVIQLLDIYEKAIKLLSTDTERAHHAPIVQDLLHNLSNELQNLITELDFDSKAGDSLLDIRNQLLIGVDGETLIQLALKVIRLVIDGTHDERQQSQLFLNTLNGDLSSLQQAMRHSLEHSQTMVSHHRDLTGELSQIQQKLLSRIQNEKSPNNQSLISSVKEACDDMLHLVERNRLLEKREQALLERLRYNEAKIASLYGQTLDYRRRLNDQERKMFMDHLTKVYNRAALVDRMEHEYKRWLRYQHPLCVAFVDIDHFKNINDNYGHIAGDKALKIIARTIYKNVSDTDFVARYGGEEFVVIMAERKKETLTKQLNAVRHAVESLPFKFRDQDVSISISIGATLFSGSDTPDKVQERADKALYDAKASGRNQLIWV